MWQNRKERPNKFTNNGDMVEKAKCEVVIQGVTNYREADLLKKSFWRLTNELSFIMFLFHKISFVR